MGSNAQHSSWYKLALSLASSSNATQTHIGHLECLLHARPVPGAKSDSREGKIQLYPPDADLVLKNHPEGEGAPSPCHVNLSQTLCGKGLCGSLDENDPYR